MEFSLCTLSVDSNPTPTVEVKGVHYRLDVVAPELLAAAPSRGLMNLFDDWGAAEGRLMALVAELQPSMEGTVRPAAEDFMTPLQYPAKLILGGANYYEHMHRDAGMPDFRKEDGMPVFFLKPPTTSLVGCGKTVRYPVQSVRLDWKSNWPS